MDNILQFLKNGSQVSKESNKKIENSSQIKVRKMQTAAGGSLKWQRVKSGNNYGYVQVTKDNRPIDYDSNTGQFRIYNSPDTSSYSYMTEFKDNTKNINRQNPEYIYETSPLNEVVVTGKMKNSPSTLNESIVTGNLKSSNYKSVYHPEDAIEFFNAVTLGGLNNLSPTQWVRRIYDTGKLATGNMSLSQYINSLVNGNSGLVSEKFEKEHPYLSTGINIVGDILPISLATTPLSTINKMELFGRNYIIPLATGVTTGVSGMYVGDNLSNYLPEEHKDVSKPLVFTMGALGAATGMALGMPKGLLKTKYTKINDVINHPLTTVAATLQGKYPWTRRLDFRLKRLLFNDIEEARVWLNNSGYDRIYLPSIKIRKRNEYRPNSIGTYFPIHHITVQPTFHKYSNLPLETGSSKLLNFKGLVNHELTHGRLRYFGNYSLYDPESGYYIARKDLNMESLNPFKLKKNGSWIASPDEFDSELSNLQITTGKNAFESIDDISPLAKRFSISKQLARNLETDILNARKALEFFKQGGKMNNVLQFLKNGSGIHIKKKNKGKFTDYCGGKVTSECIQRGKNSPNPAIRKRATFAANARKWKHLLGGQISKAQEGLKLNFGLKVGNFLNSDLGKSALSFISNGVNAISNQSKITNFSNEFDKATEAGKKNLLIQNWNKKYQEGLAKGLQYFQMQQLYNPGINFGTIDIQNFAKNYADSAGTSLEVNEYENNRLALKKDYIQSMLQSASSSGGFDIAGLLGTAGKFLSSKSKTSDSSTPISTPVTDNYDYINWTSNYYA